MQQKDKLLTIVEVAKQLRVDHTTVRRWIKMGIMEAITLPHIANRQVCRVKQSTVNLILEGCNNE